MAQESSHPDGEVVLTEEVGNVRLITLNRPKQLNVISSKVVKLLAENLEKWEKDDDVAFIILKGAGRAFSAGGDLRMFYDGRGSKDSCLEVVYRMYWLCYHIYSYQKPLVSLVHGIAMGGGASLMVPTISIVTEKTVFATPEASIGFHTDCGFSHFHSQLPGRLGEYLALTGARLNGKELYLVGLASYFVPSDRLPELEKRLLSLNTGDDLAIRSTIEEFSVRDFQIDEDSVWNKQEIIDECFSKDSVEEIVKSFEAEAGKEGNDWIQPVLKNLKRSSPTGLKITLRSIREARKQSRAECTKKEFRVTMNILREMISGDVYEGIRAINVDKDNSPKWDPSTLESVYDVEVDKVFGPFEEHLELKVPETNDDRWSGKYESSAYAQLQSA